jgi:hypothetical protein
MKDTKTKYHGVENKVWLQEKWKAGSMKYIM